MGVLAFRASPLVGGRSQTGRAGCVAALDVGTSKIACLIAKPIEAGGLDVIGSGVTRSEGIRAGAIIDMDAAQNAIRAAARQAERNAGIAISKVTVGFSGGRLASQHVTGATNLASEREVGDRDMRRAIDAALGQCDVAGRAVLHAIPLCWAVDSHTGVRDPRGMTGARLSVDLHVVTAEAGPMRNLTACVERADLQLRTVVAAPYAAGLSTLVDDERNLGATLVDMGAGVTTTAVFFDGFLQYVDTTPVGGGHVSNDIARCLSTPLAAAEHFKRFDGSVIEAPGDDALALDCPQMGAEEHMIRASRADLAHIIRPRLEETFELVRARLRAADMDVVAGRRAALTGGASQLAGASEFAGIMLGKRVRIAQPRGVDGLPVDQAGPDFSVAVGLLRHASSGPREAARNPARKVRSNRTSRPPRPPVQGDIAGLKRAVAWLRENF